MSSTNYDEDTYNRTLRELMQDTKYEDGIQVSMTHFPALAEDYYFVE